MNANSMVTSVALLRGINVGSANRMTMAALTQVFTGLGYVDVRTILQSGNVVFDSPRPLGPSATIALEDELANATGVQARMLIIDAARFLEIAAANPLEAIADDPSRMVITFLDAAPPAGLHIPHASDLKPEVLAIGDAAIYQWCPLGVSKSKVPPKFFRQLGANATARNQRTVARIAAMLPGSAAN